MNTKLVVLALVTAAAFSGCDKIAPPSENSSQAPVTTQAVVNKPAFTPRLLDAPVLGIYMPDFSYSVRSQTKGSADNQGKASVALEFWGASVDQAEQQVREKLLSSGFKLGSKNSGNGSHSGHYASVDGADVLVNVSPIGSRKRTAPESVGTIYFEWKE